MNPLIRYFGVLTLCGMAACTSTPETDGDTYLQNNMLSTYAPAQPDRAPYMGFEWELVRGAGIMFWAQQSKNIRVGTSETLPGAFVEQLDNGEPVALSVAIQIFDLPDGHIHDVLATLQDLDTTGELKHCHFVRVDEEQKARSAPSHATRYQLEPFGEALNALQLEMADSPVTHSCGGWGQANSGIRYFEVHHNRPDKALFIEIGQEAPLFDADGIVFLPQ